MQQWKRIEPTTVTKVGWRKVTTKTFVMPDGKESTFDTVHPDGQEFAGVIALTPDNKVIVARQYRPGPEKVMDDLPGGFVDKGEDPETAMRRELREETGYEAGKVTYLGTFHKDVYMNATWHAFIAYDCTKVSEPENLDDEFIELDLISIDELIEKAKHDQLQDHAVVLMAYDELQRLQHKS